MCFGTQINIRQLSYFLRGSAETLYVIYLIREEDEKAAEVQKFILVFVQTW
jgi:hypothetical protein